MYLKGVKRETESSSSSCSSEDTKDSASDNIDFIIWNSSSNFRPWSRHVCCSTLCRVLLLILLLFLLWWGQWWWRWTRWISYIIMSYHVNKQDFTKCIQCPVKSEVRGSIWFQITKFSLNFSPDTRSHDNFIRNNIWSYTWFSF